jgi:hypothetical protein
MSHTLEREAATVTVDGETVRLDAATTGAELKAFVDADRGAALTYHQGRKVRHILDDERVLNHVSPGAELATWTRWFGPLLVGPGF